MGIQNRWRLHCASNSTCGPLKRAISEYGKSAFIIEQVDSADTREELNQKERFWIEKENTLAPNGYNKKPGGYHITYSQEAKRRMSENHSNVKGAKNPMYGKSHSIKTRKLISDRLAGRYTGENSFFHKAVINLDTGEVFITATEAAKKYGITVSTLTKTCRGVQKRSANYRWRFYEEKEVVPNDSSN